MKISASDPLRRPRWGRLVFLAVWLMGSAAVPAAETAPSRDNAAADPIHITADSLTADGDSRNVEFIGNVEARQGATKITCERLKILYAEEGGTGAAPSPSDAPAAEAVKAGGAAISRIVATGGVTIEFQEYIAYTQHAEFIAAEKKMILSGADSRIVSGGNSISGSKITIFQDGGRISVESAPEKRVEAFIYSDEGTLPSLGNP